MSKESFNLLKGAGYHILHKMGRQKFIPAFPPRSVKSKARADRSLLIKNLLLEILADSKITERIRRSEDMVKLSLKVEDILCSPEYIRMKNPDKLRYTIAQLIVDPEHRKAVEKILKENKKRNFPKFEPICKVPQIKDPSTVLETIFENYIDAWDAVKYRYKKNKAARKFHLAMKDLVSKDWLHHHCILAGYVPVSKRRKLGEIGRLVATSCGCRKIDRFEYKKSYMEKLRRETMNYRYHTMHKTLKRINQRSVICFHRRPYEDGYMHMGRQKKPGVWTRVFLASHSQPLDLPVKTTESDEQISVKSEKELIMHQLKDMSSPKFSNSAFNNVAIKVFAMSPNLPLKLLPARIITLIELSTVLDHPNIVKFIESFASKRDIFMVMRYEENRNLHNIITKNGRLMQKTAKVWTFQIALALQYLHSAGIVHRNVKCSNILITQDYDAVLTGLGSAKVKWMDLLHIHVAESKNYNVGYPPYRAPEVLQRKPYCMAPIDVWSLGVVLFVMLNNSFPYCYHNKKLMLRAQLLKKWKRGWNRSFPTSKLCLDLLKRMLAPKPSERLKIDDVVSHSWYKKLPVPKAHKKSMKQAPFLFLIEESKSKDDKQALSHHPSHRVERDTLDEINAILGSIINRTEKRTFKALDDFPEYQACYPKNLRPNNLLGMIDAWLRQPARRRYRPKSDYEYEPYISERDELEMYERTATNIEELRERTEQVRKILEPSRKEDKAKKTLKDIVNKVKEKAERTKLLDEKLMRKVAVFMPKALAQDSEPRSILQLKTMSNREKIGNDLKGRTTASKLSVSTTTNGMRSMRLGLGVQNSKDFSNMDFQSMVTLSKRPQDGTTLPKLEFVKHHGSRSFSGTRVIPGATNEH